MIRSATSFKHMAERGLFQSSEHAVSVRQNLEGSPVAGSQSYQQMSFKVGQTVDVPDIL